MPLRRHPIEQVIIFTRYPEAGKVKTRLIHEPGGRSKTGKKAV